MDPALFGDINLIVGKNASGKSRLLNLIYSLAGTVSATRSKLFGDGSYLATFESTKDQYVYHLDIADNKVIKEILTINDITRLDRDTDGKGTIYNQAEDRDTEFQAPPEQVVVATRRDAIQHPFFDDIFGWGKSARQYRFGSPFGQTTLRQIQQREIESAPDEITNPDFLVELFSQGESLFGQEFKDAILQDLAVLGYECTDINVIDVSEYLQPKVQAFAIAVQEKSLKTPTVQLFMSQGMYRALALFIHLNFMQLQRTPGCILIDDIGEGLDYGRSSTLVAMLIERAKQQQFQLLMTTNDRFIMNGVDLKYWSILLREGSHIQIFNQQNSTEAFDEFEYIGLDNFDFFTSDYFLGKPSAQ